MRTLVRVTIFCIVCICSYCCVFASDSTKVRRCKITLASGSELVGEIVREDSSGIVLKSEGVESKVSRTHIKQVTYLNADELESEETTVFRKKSKKETSEFVGGLTLGTPAVGHVRVGGRFDGWAMHASLGYWGEVYGIQLSPMLLLSRDEKTYHYLSGMVGYSHLRYARVTSTWNYINIREQVEWLYAGAGYVFNTRGFFLELGLTAGAGSFSTPQLIFQIGYVN